MIRKFVVASVSVIALSAAASAADMYAPGPGGYKDFGPIATWAGFYAGVNGGYAWGTEADVYATSGTYATNYTPTAYKSASAIGDGGFGGGQIGYNIQRDRLVFGLEADFEGAGVTGSATAAPSTTSSAKAETDLDWFGTVRGRLGLTFPDWGGLLYVTGGFAYGGIEHKLTDTTGPLSVSNDRTGTGYVLGAGYEHFVTPRLSLKAEYQYIDLGSDSLQVKGSASANATYFDSFSTVRAGLNYHLGAVYEPLK